MSDPPAKPYATTPGQSFTSAPQRVSPAAPTLGFPGPGAHDHTPGLVYDGKKTGMAFSFAGGKVQTEGGFYKATAEQGPGPGR